MTEFTVDSLKKLVTSNLDQLRFGMGMTVTVRDHISSLDLTSNDDRDSGWVTNRPVTVSHEHRDADPYSWAWNGISLKYFFDVKLSF